MTIHLRHTEGSKKGSTDSFDSDRIRIGRQVDNDLKFDPEVDRAVSGHHAEIYRQGDTLLIKDLQSRNGTFVNGRRVTQPTPITEGDVIQFAPGGPKVVFSQRLPSAEPAAMTRPPGEITPPQPGREPVPISTAGLIALATASLAILAGLVYAIWSAHWILLAALLSVLVVVASGLMVWWWTRRRGPLPAPPEVAREEVRPAPGERVEGENLRDLRKNWEEALTTLRKSRIQKGRGDPVYAVPWILVLGESGSGKTETIRAANPLSWLSATGTRPGTFPTRNCDWWFFDEAVLLDTAGRYAFPTAEQVDGAEWREVLALLKRSRPQEPIDGAIIAVSSDALVSRPAEKLQAEASQFRRRLDEMAHDLGTTFPVYLLVTKMDLVPGFTEFCSGLPAAVRGQAMGAANEDPQGRAGATVFLDRAFRSILETLNRLRLARMDEEEIPETLRKLFLFPEEFRSLRRPLRAFTDALFRQNPYQESPALRGIFLTSARQGQVPLSRLSQALSLPSPRTDPVAPAGSFFARDLFSVILSQDRPLVGRTTLWHQRYQRAQTVAFVAIVALCVLAAGLFTLSFIRNSQALSRLDLDACLKAPTTSAEGLLASRLRGLDGCRETIEGLTPRSIWGRVASDFGLGYSHRITMSLRQRYLQAFQVWVLDPLDTRIDQRIQPGREAPLYVSALLQRAKQLARCRSQDGCPRPEESVRPNYKVMLTAEDPDVKGGDPRVAHLERTYEAYLRWHLDPRSLEEMEARQVQRVMRWLQSGGLRAEWVLASASAQFPAVGSRDFWGVDTGPQVDSPFTHRAWAEGIQPLLSGLKELAPEAKEVREPLTQFELNYRNEVFRQWERFLANFPQGERVVGGRSAGRDLATRILGPDSPYMRVLDVAASNLAPFLAMAAQGGDVPSWAITLQRFGELKAKAGPWQKGAGQKAEETQSKSGAEDRQSLGYLTGYLEALDQLRGEISTPEKAFKSAQKTYEEGEPSDKASAPMHKAVWNRDRLQQAIGARQGEDRIFWALLGRPAEFAWRAVLDQAGVFLQQHWESVRLELTDLPPGPKAGKVLAFVNGQAAPFLERRRDGYAARALLNDSIAFTRPFLDYLSRSRQESPDELGKLDPPRQIVASL